MPLYNVRPIRTAHILNPIPGKFRQKKYAYIYSEQKNSYNWNIFFLPHGSSPFLIRRLAGRLRRICAMIITQNKWLVNGA